jgi:hypothetical protein
MGTPYLHTKFHTPSYNVSLVIAIRPKNKYIFHAAAMLFYKIKKNSYHGGQVASMKLL